jgi:hypothetical protein
MRVHVAVDNAKSPRGARKSMEVKITSPPGKRVPRMHIRIRTITMPAANRGELSNLIAAFIRLAGNYAVLTKTVV